MKKSLSFHSLALILPAILLLFTPALTGCKKDKARAALKAEVEVANEKCPIRFSVGTLDKIEYDEDDNIVEMDYIFSGLPAEIDFSTFLDNKESIRETFLLYIGDPQFRSVSERIIAADAGLKIEYKDDRSGRKIDIEISSADLKKALAHKSTDRERYSQIVDLQITIGNDMCPARVDEYTTLVSVGRDGDGIVYDYDIDENGITVREAESEIMALKKDIRASLLKDPSTVALVNVLKKANGGLRYRYKGKTTGYATEIVFTPEELKQL